METSSVLVDTTIVIDHFRKKDKKNSYLFKIVNNSNAFISSISLYELFAGAIDDQKRKDVKDLIAIMTTLPFTNEIAEHAGQIFVSLRQRNKLIDIRDIFIGSTALVFNLPIATLNVKHFERIENLKFYNL